MSEKVSDSTLTFLEKKELNAEDLHNAIQHVASTKEGELLIDYLCFIAGVTVFKAVRSDDDRLRQEGQRQLVWGLLEYIALDESKMKSMITERIRLREQGRKESRNQRSTNE